MRTNCSCWRHEGFCRTLTRYSLLHIQRREAFHYQGLSLNDESKQPEQECLIFYRPPTGAAVCRESHLHPHIPMEVLIKTTLLTVCPSCNWPHLLCVCARVIFVGYLRLCNRSFFGGVQDIVNSSLCKIK